MSHHPSTRRLLVPGLLLALAAGLLVGRADAVTSTGTISGVAADTQGNRLGQIRVRIFQVQSGGSWAFLTTVSASSKGSYSTGQMSPGRYVLQFVDVRPSYDKTKHVTTDVKVTLAEGTDRTDVNARMPVGASLWGKAWRHGKTAPYTTVKAVRDGDQTGTVYSSRSDAGGGYLLGGLPKGTYTVFVYDHARAWAGKVRRVTLSRYGVSTKLTFPMDTRAGRYAGRILTSKGVTILDTPYVTAVNRSTGQFWVVKVVNGQLSALTGLSPGSYKLTVPGVDQHLGQRFNLPSIRAGRTTDAGSVVLRHQGGFVAGTVVDPDGDPLAGVEVTIYDKYSHPFETVRTSAAGRFKVGGSIPDADGPVSITLRARNPIDEVRYTQRNYVPMGDVVAGQTAEVGTVTMTPVPAPTPTATTTAPPAP